MQRRLRIAASLAALTAAAGFYGYTSARSLGLADTTMLVDAIQQRRISTHVNNHNVAVLAGVLVSMTGADPVRGAHLASVVLGALAVGLFHALVLRCVSTTAAAVATVAFAVSHSQWWHSTVAEAYAANQVFLLIGLHLIERMRGGSADRMRSKLFFLGGLGLFNHVQLAALLLAGFAAVLWRVLYWRRRATSNAMSSLPGGRRPTFTLIMMSAGAAVLGLLPYLITLVLDARRAGGVRIAAESAAGGPFRQMMFGGSLPSGLADSAFLAVMQYPSPYLVAVLIGIPLLARAWRGEAAAALWTLGGVTAIFFSLYDTWDRFAFLLPVFNILALAGAYGIEWLISTLARRGRIAATAGIAAFTTLSAILPPLVYAGIAPSVHRGGVWSLRYNPAGTRNSHDVVEYVANPNKRYNRDVEVFSGALFAVLPRGAVYVDDDSRLYYPLRYQQLYEGRRLDLELYLLNSWGFSGWGLSPEALTALIGNAYRQGRELYVVSLDAPFGRTLARAPALFEQFPIGNGRWVYRMMQARDLDRARIPDSVRPAGAEIIVAAGQPWTAEVRLPGLAVALPVTVAWVEPSGQTAFRALPAIAPPGTTSLTFELPDVPRAGEWRAEAWVGDSRVAATTFVVPR
jgi:hypothetical protein